MRAPDPPGGLDNGIARHKLHGDALLKGIQAMGLETFGDLKHKMNNVLGVVIPQGSTATRYAS
jgi:(S)-ureidoglycine-glyoxylate aminotransferase